MKQLLAFGTFHMTKSRRIVVLEDARATPGSVKRTLKAHGFEAEIFATVEDFLGRALLGDAICLILDVDLSGPSAINLARQLARSRLSLPVLFLTGNESKATRKAALEATCVAYLGKHLLPA